MTGDEAQAIMGRRKMRVENASCSFSPSRLPLRANFIERETAGYETESGRFRFAFLFEKSTKVSYSKKNHKP